MYIILYIYILLIVNKLLLFQIVVVKKESTWKRAVIEEKIEGSSYKYEVWDLDYGQLEQTSTIYKLNPKFDLNVLPPFVHQASLWNVVFLNEVNFPKYFKNTNNQ